MGQYDLKVQNQLTECICCTLIYVCVYNVDKKFSVRTFFKNWDRFLALMLTERKILTIPKKQQIIF